MAVLSKIPATEPRPECWPNDDDDGEGDDENAGDEVAGAALAPKIVEEDAPAQPSDGAILRAGLGGGPVGGFSGHER
jgi:hypothetical protein